MAIAYSSVAPAHRPPALANYTGTEAVGSSAIAPNPSSAFPLIELHVSARRLKKLDVITDSDPMCVMFAASSAQGDHQWAEVARTEVVWNNLNPDWVTYFTVMYVFEMRQPLLFRVYDVDSPTALSDQDFIGEATIELAQLIAQPGSTELQLSHPTERGFRGTLAVAHEKVENCASIVKARFVCTRLKKCRFLLGNDPFFVIAKSSEGSAFLPVFQSEVNKQMRWRSFEVSFQALCNTEPDRPIRITFFDHRSQTAAVPIGYHDTTFARMSESLGQTARIVDVNGSDVGEFIFSDISMIQKYTFYDYLRGRLELNLTIAIDFTGSNLGPDNPKSLHYLSPDGDSMNQYEQCIAAVGEVLCPYDSDQLFPVLGFGAKVERAVSHCFPLTFNSDAPCVHGLEGIQEVYRHAVGQVEFSGPTYFGPVIRYATQKALEAFQNGRTYTILLILTDGIINDMNETKDAIVAAGRAPLSIIIVGVGLADFSEMNVLDADDVPLVSRTGQRMCRDIVQFVPFRNFVNKHYSALGQAVLDEVPKQVCEWADMNGVYPL